MYGSGCAVFVLQVVAVEALDIAEFAFGHGGSVAAGLVEAFTGRLYAHQGYGLVVHKGIEQADGIGTAAHAGNDFIRQAALLTLELFACFVADNTLEIGHHFGIRCWTDHGADGKHAAVDLFQIGGESAINGFFERACPGGYGHEFSAEDFHAGYIGVLFGNIDHAHVDFAFEAEQGGGGGERYAMLACAGFGNHFFLAEFFGQQHFADAVVDFVGAG